MFSTSGGSEYTNRMYSKQPLSSHNSYLYTSTTARPLWSARNMFDKEYLHVQLLADNEVPFQKSTDDILNMNLYTCHICDTQVPTSHTKEHNNGEKHNTFIKIADLALERTRKHMKSKTKESRLSIQVTETYYCEPCELIVQNINKIKHELSEKHVKSMKHDQLLKKFLMIYENKDNFDSVEEMKCNGTFNPNEYSVDLSESIEPVNCKNVPANNKLINETLKEDPNADKMIKKPHIELVNASNADCENANTNSKPMDKTFKEACDNTVKQIIPQTKQQKVSNAKASNIDNVTSEDNLEQLSDASKIMITSKTDNLEQLSKTSERMDTGKSDNVKKSKKVVAHKTNKNTFEDRIDALFEKFAQSVTNYFSENSTNPITKAEKKGNSQKASTELSNYLRIISEKCKIDPIHSLEAFSDKLILITALNGDKIKVPVASFHSIHNQKDKSYCKICEDPNVGYKHEYSEEHMEKVMTPIEDKNAIRKIDDIWSHCVMCNDLTKNVNFHLQSLVHKNKLKHCLVESGTDINDNVVHKTQPQKDASQLIQEHSLILSHDSSQITCNICVTTIQNQVASIKEHIETFNHITNYNDVIEKNKLSEIDDLQYYCMPCDMCVAKCYALGHCNGKKHNKHLTDVLVNEIVTEEDKEQCTQIILPSISQQVKRMNTKPSSRSQNTDSELICFVCNIVLYNIDKHMNSLDHKKSYFSYLEANKLNEIEEDTYYCIPCNTVILIDYLMYHCTSKKHKNLLKTFMNNAESKDLQAGSSGQLIAENTHISRSIARSVQNQAAHQATSHTQTISLNGIFDTAIPLKYLYQFREMSLGRNLLCTICDDEVPYRKYEVQAHVNSIEHVVAFNLMMLWNKVKRLNDKYYCDVCKVEVTYFNELTHVTSSQHVSVMAEQPKGTVYEYDKKLLTLEYAMSHKVGDRVRASSLISVSKPKDTP